MLKYASIGLKFFSLGLVIAAASFWAGAEVKSRPKYKDEQTLVGGTVWTQTIIPIGLIISTIVDEELSVIVHGYFLIAGFLLLVTTGVVLIIEEYNSMNRSRRRQTDLSTPQSPSSATDPTPTYDRIYFGIGVLSLLASFFTLADFIIIII